MKRILLYLALSVFTFAALKPKGSSAVIKEEIITLSQNQPVHIEPKIDHAQALKNAPSIKEKAHILLKAGGCTNVEKIKITSHDDTSCSDDKTIWMNTGWELGPQDYVLAHECGHVVCGHYTERCERDVTDAEMKAQEKEADLMACKILCDLNLQEIIEARIEEIQYAIDQKWKQSDTNDHPTLQEMRDYIANFLEEYNNK